MRSHPKIAYTYLLLLNLIGAVMLPQNGYAQFEDGTQQAWNNVSSSVAPPGGGLFDINAFVGANTYYNAGIIGQNTLSTVAEAGHIWNGTESLTHVTNFYSSSFSYGGTNTNSRIDRHATWVGGVIGGREVISNPQIYQKGIAYGTTLGTAAIANNWAGSAYTLSFGWNYNSWTGGILPAFANSDVINQSYGFTDTAGTNIYTRMMDALANANSKVISIGSSGNTTNAGTVGSPAAGYNTVSVGALGNANSYDSVASFSSRGPQNWGYRTSGGTFVIITNVRAVVDIVAPGTSIIAPFYGAQTGGNNPTLSGSTNLGTNPAQYSALNGTSFSAPIVAGGASLIMSAAKTLPELENNSEATESVVIKALMLNGATKITGWNNGQITNNGVVTTTQSLDYASGAGALNLGATFTNQTLGQKGLDGKFQGNQGVVEALGWDFGASLLTGTNSYMLSGLFSSNSTFTGTLSWLRQVSMNTTSSVTNATDIAEANLNLKVWTMNSDGSIGNLVGSSESTYNLTEHLQFQLPSTGYYIVGVEYLNNSFDNTANWGSGTNSQNYGIAWMGTSSENIYWQGGSWDNEGAWNTQANGMGISTTNSSVVVNTIFGDGSPSQSPLSTIIDGNQYTKGLGFQSAEMIVSGTNNANLAIGLNGIVVENSTTGAITIAPETSITLYGDQTWNNKSSQNLEVLGEISGFGNLSVSNGSSTAQVNLGSLDYIGSFENKGSGITKVNEAINSTVSSVAQSGSGKLELNALNSYTGTTSVSSGDLTVNGSIASSSLTTVSSSGTLTGNGIVGNTLITASGTINPGDSPGILTIDGDLTWDINGNYNWEIYDASGVASTGYDTIYVTGVLNLSLLSTTEDFSINLWSLSGLSPDENGNAINFNPNADYLWTIVSTDNGVVGFNAEFFDINTIANNGTTGFSNSLNGNFSLSVNNNDLILEYNTVPEPQTIALLILTAGFFWARNLYKKRF